MLPAKTQPRQKKKNDSPILRLIHPATVDGSFKSWRINHQIFTIHCWTDEEIASLKNPPPDAVPYPNGIWIALRSR